MSDGLLVAMVLAVSAALWVWASHLVTMNRRLKVRQEALAAFMPQTDQKESEVSVNRWRSLGARLVLPSERTWLRKRLNALGKPGVDDLDQVYIQRAKAFVLGGGTAILLGLAGGLPWLVVTLVVVVAYLYPNAMLYNAAHYREIELSRRLPGSIDLLVVAVESGMSFPAALRLIAEKDSGPVAEEWSRVLREIDLGQSRSAALANLRERTDHEPLQQFSVAVNQAETLGISLAPVLREQAETLRRTRRERAREQSQKIPVKILFPIMVCFVPSIFLIVLGPIGLSFAR